jgi:UDP:flavonoid glycosyltransferase YjiC (YdhE family)
VRRALIDLVAPPFAGHLHPLLGIGRRLALDHEVRVISTERALPEVAGAQLTGLPLLRGRDREIAAIVDGPRAVRSHPLRLHAQLQANLALLEQFRAELREVWARQRPDLLIADLTLPVAGAVAGEMGVPWWTSHPSPCVVETPDGPPAYLGGWRPGGGALGRCRDAAGRALVRAFKRGVHRLHRRQLARLGFPALYRADGSEAVYSGERVLALGTRELEFPRRWPAAVELVGPVLYTPPGAPQEQPVPFVPGRRHVLVTLGTHLAWRKDAMAAAARRAARDLDGVEIHMSDGERWSERRESEGSFHRLGYVPYATCIEHYDLVVHHGGTGVLYHTLRAGKPALVAPIDYDQFDHAARLEAAGLARRLRWRRDLAPQIAAALADRQLLATCRRFQGVLAGYQAEERIAALVAARVK